MDEIAAYVEAADEATLRRAVGAVADTFRTLRETGEASEALGRSAKGDVLGKDVAATQALGTDEDTASLWPLMRLRSISPGWAPPALGLHRLLRRHRRGCAGNRPWTATPPGCPVGRQTLGRPGAAPR